MCPSTAYQQLPAGNYACIILVEQSLRCETPGMVVRRTHITRRAPAVLLDQLWVIVMRAARKSDDEAFHASK